MPKNKTAQPNVYDDVTPTEYIYNVVYVRLPRVESCGLFLPRIYYTSINNMQINRCAYVIISTRGFYPLPSSPELFMRFILFFYTVGSSCALIKRARAYSPWTIYVYWHADNIRDNGPHTLYHYTRGDRDDDTGNTDRVAVPYEFQNDLFA